LSDPDGESGQSILPRAEIRVDTIERAP
jgi:hypothetical protein